MAIYVQACLPKKYEIVEGPVTLGEMELFFELNRPGINVHAIMRQILEGRVRCVHRSAKFIPYEDYIKIVMELHAYFLATHPELFGDKNLFNIKSVGGVM